MNIAVIGTGYVGLVTGALFAQRGNKVICVDKNEAIVDKLQSGHIHIFEPGLEHIVSTTVKRGDLRFTSNTKEAVKDADIIFLAVGTPSGDDGRFNLTYLRAAAQEVAQGIRESQGFKVIVVKSTVPQGTWQDISSVIDKELEGSNVEWGYVSNPETLAEGTAVRDFSKPDRIIIGTISDKAYEYMEELYHPFVLKKDRIIRGTPSDAELAKLFSNTALACRISMINEFARVADVTPKADMDVIRQMVCSDDRIGYNFMFPSPGYGGSCFPKDIQGVVAKSSEHGYEPLMVSKIHQSNEDHKTYMAERIISTVKGKKVCIWGLTFKPNTDDMRDAPSLIMVKKLTEAGITICAYEPQDEKAKEIFGEKVQFFDDKYKAAEEADALVLLTEWKQFDSPNYRKLGEIMNGKQIYDFRNRWLPEIVNNYGFEYFGVGRTYKQ